jgi:Na+/H+-dicarboxylate symporter
MLPANDRQAFCRIEHLPLAAVEVIACKHPKMRCKMQQKAATSPGPQVLFAIGLGVFVGILFPALATNDWVKALGDGFIKLIRMMIAPIIFCTVGSGIAHIEDARKVGRVGTKALVYFEIV